MNGAHCKSAARPSGLKGGRHFEVVVVYEDFATGVWGKQVFDRLRAEFGRRLRLNCRLWKFEVLRVQSLEAMAAEDAAQADLVLVVAHGSGGLPTEVKAWLADWVPHRRQQPRALVCLLDRQPDTPASRNPVAAYLQQIARQGRMDFFCADAEGSVAPTAPWPQVEAGRDATWLRVETLLRHHAPQPGMWLGD